MEGATYEKLLKACVKVGNKDGAQKIVDLLKGKASVNIISMRNMCSSYFASLNNLHSASFPSMF